MNKYWSFLVLALVCSSLFGQKGSYLHVGDTVPNFLIEHIVNGEMESTWLYDIKTPVLLDGFATTCGSCIALLPHLDRVRQQYKEDLSIFVVTYEDTDVIEKFLNSNRKAKGIGLPFSTADTQFHSLFRYHSIPHEVWIGSDHVVKAITGYQYVNDENLTKFVNNETLDLPVKDDYVEYDPDVPLEFYDQAHRKQYSSTFTGHLDNLIVNNSREFLLKDSLFKKIVFRNCSIFKFLKCVFAPYTLNNRVEILARDSSLFFRPADSKVEDLWGYNHSYCYEITVPRELPDSVVHSYIFQDVEKAFNLDIKYGEKDMPCYVLVKSGSASMDPLATGGKSRVNFYPKDGQPVIIQNSSISRLIAAMNAFDYGRRNQIVLDETGITQNVTMKLLVNDCKDMVQMNKALAPYGLALEKAVRPIKMVVVKDR